MDFLVPSRYCGPPESGNGGWVSGHLAALVEAGGAVTVRLLSPPPLDREMQVLPGSDALTLVDGAIEVAQARRATPLDTEPPGPIPFTTAAAAATEYPGLHEHPFPTCFSCGIARDPGDALCLRTGPVGAGVHAAAWVPGEVTPEIVWAALDCPGAWALGTMTAKVDALPALGEEHVIVAWKLGESGRKHYSDTALYAGDRLLAQARATWIVIDPATIRPA